MINEIELQNLREIKKELEAIEACKKEEVTLKSTIEKIKKDGEKVTKRNTAINLKMVEEKQAKKKDKRIKKISNIIIIIFSLIYCSLTAVLSVMCYKRLGDDLTIAKRIVCLIWFIVLSIAVGSIIFYFISIEKLRDE